MRLNEFLTCQEINGSLCVKKDGRIVRVEYLELTKDSLLKIYNIVESNGNIKAEDQFIEIKQIDISSDDYIVFMEGLGYPANHGSVLQLEVQSRTKLRFKADLKAIYNNLSNEFSVCNIELGSIQFENHSKPVFEDTIVHFYNMTATMYKDQFHYKIEVNN